MTETLLDGVTSLEQRRVTTFNEYFEVDITPQTHDANGNLTNDGQRRYEWDAFNRLRRVTDLSGTTTIASYLYDAGHRRVRKDLPGTAGDIDYAYGGWQVVEQYEAGAAAPSRRFVFGAFINEPLLMEVEDSAAWSAHYYHANTIYSVGSLTDSAGALVERYDYDPYGAHVLAVGSTRTSGGASSVGNPFTFTAHVFDAETGNHWMRMRYYNAELVVFVSRDPIGVKGGLHLGGYINAGVFAEGGFSLSTPIGNRSWLLPLVDEKAEWNPKYIFPWAR